MLRILLYFYLSMVLYAGFLPVMEYFCIIVFRGQPVQQFGRLIEHLMNAIGWAWLRRWPMAAQPGGSTHVVEVMSLCTFTTVTDVNTSSPTFSQSAAPLTVRPVTPAAEWNAAQHRSVFPQVLWRAGGRRRCQIFPQLDGRQQLVQTWNHQPQDETCRPTLEVNVSQAFISKAANADFCLQSSCCPERRNDQKTEASSGRSYKLDLHNANLFSQLGCAVLDWWIMLMCNIWDLSALASVC